MLLCENLMVLYFDNQPIKFLSFFTIFDNTILNLVNPIYQKNMKTKLKRILIIAVVGIIIIPVGFFTWFSLKVNSEGKKLNHLPTKELIDSVLCISDGKSNFFLIKENEKYIAFDAGQDVDKIQVELKKNSIDCQNITAVFLTHSDRDHVAALKLFTKAQVYLSKDEKQLVDTKKRRLLIFSNKLPDRIYTTLSDGEVVNIGKIKIEGILTPGHTSGSMCYVVNDRDLFTGDAFSIKNGKVEAFNDFFNMDSDQSIISLKKISGLHNVAYFFTGHYGYGEYFRYFKTGE